MKYKKSYDHFCKGKLEKIINIMDINKHIYGVRKLCKVLGIPRSTYYAKLNHTTSIREIENKKIKAEIIKKVKEDMELLKFMLF